MKISYLLARSRIASSLILLVSVTLGMNSSHAYKEETHREMSEVSVNRSVLVVDPGLLKDLDIDVTDIFPNVRNDQRSVYDLIFDGAVFEDAINEIDSGGEDLRMKHHFYNVQNGGSALNDPPLVPGIFGQSYSSVVWALEDQELIPSQNFSMKDGYDYLYKALTEEQEASRKFNWGRMFQTLGHVIHHVQDMAQPQHTRNDSHTPISSGRDYFEFYTERKRLRRGLPYEGYPDLELSEFNSAKAFWDGPGDPQHGTGLAEFSGTNFISAGTNFRGGSVVGNTIAGAQTSSGQNLPAANNLLITTIDAEDLNLVGPLVPLTGQLHHIGTQVSDNHNQQNSGFNPKTSSFALLDSDLDRIGGELTYMLNSDNIDAAHQYLIPKAVAYSAGLINYFFRGRIDVELTNNRDGIEVTNVSSANYAFKSGGTFEVLYETDAGLRKPITSLNNLTLETGLAVNETQTITGLSSALQNIPDIGEEGKIVVLFDGDIGEERGLAPSVTWIPIANPFMGVSTSGYSRSNSGFSTYSENLFDQISVVYLIEGNLYQFGDSSGFTEIIDRNSHTRNYWTRTYQTFKTVTTVEGEIFHKNSLGYNRLFRIPYDDFSDIVAEIYQFQKVVTYDGSYPDLPSIEFFDPADPKYNVPGISTVVNSKVPENEFTSIFGPRVEMLELTYDEGPTDPNDLPRIPVDKIVKVLLFAYFQKTELCEPVSLPSAFKCTENLDEPVSLYDRNDFSVEVEAAFADFLPAVVDAWDSTRYRMHQVFEKNYRGSPTTFRSNGLTLEATIIGIYE